MELILIGYDPADGNRIKFINTDRRYLERMRRTLGRPMNVNDFWHCDNNLISLHVPQETLPDIDNAHLYYVQDGEVFRCKD